MVNSKNHMIFLSLLNLSDGLVLFFGTCVILSMIFNFASNVAAIRTGMMFNHLPKSCSGRFISL